jgi:hypothetical protein
VGAASAGGVLMQVYRCSQVMYGALKVIYTRFKLNTLIILQSTDMTSKPSMMTESPNKRLQSFCFYEGEPLNVHVCVSCNQKLT